MGRCSSSVIDLWCLCRVVCGFAEVPEVPINQARGQRHSTTLGRVDVEPMQNRPT